MQNTSRALAIATLAFVCTLAVQSASVPAGEAKDEKEPTPLRVITVKGDPGSVYRSYQFTFSPDSKLIGGEDKVWDVASGKEVDLLAGAPGHLWAFCPDGKKLALVPTTAMHTVKLYDPVKRVELATLRNPSRATNKIEALAFSVDGKLLAFGAGLEMYVWDTTTGKPKFMLPMAQPRLATFSPDGRTLATNHGKGHVEIRLWDAKTGKPKRTLKGHKGAIYNMVFSPGGETLVSTGSGDPDIRLWDTATGKSRGTLPRIDGPGEISPMLAYNVDGATLATAHGSGMVRIWDARTTKLRFAFKAHSVPIKAIALSPDGKLLGTGAYKDSIKLWANRWVSENPDK